MPIVNGVALFNRAKARFMTTRELRKSRPGGSCAASNYKHAKYLYTGYAISA